MNPPSAERQLGEYRLQQLLEENDISRTWLAEQTSVARSVIVDELRPDRPYRKESFLADIRAKAAVDHPLIGSVYEAVAEAGQCYYAHELLPGKTLAAPATAGKMLSPSRLAHVLRRVSEANVQNETLGHATSTLGLESIHLDEHGVIRLKNLAIAGVRTPEDSVRDIVHLGNALVPLVAAGQPGATRMLTLFSWMRGEGLEAPIDWGQTRDFCMQIEHQLADPLSLLKPAGAKKQPVALIAIATVVVLAAIVLLALKMRPPAPAAPPRASLPGPIAVPAGPHPTPDGGEENFPAFRISAHEVTIGQYAGFLDALAVLAKDKSERTFDARDQPPAKISHEPLNWPALLAAAKTGGLYQGQPATLDSPVAGIDWWDATAYAEWKQARLPRQEEWFAALHRELKSPAALVPGPWAPVTLPTIDRTPAGLLGMAGSLCEWTATPAANPANPLGEKLWVIAGGSHLKPGSNALTREWTPDRALRRPDLGFRVVFDGE